MTDELKVSFTGYTRVSASHRLGQYNKLQFFFKDLEMLNMFWGDLKTDTNGPDTQFQIA